MNPASTRTSFDAGAQNFVIDPSSAELLEMKPLASIDEVLGRKIGRNELCGCGSGLKFKRCCSEQRAREQSPRDLAAERLLEMCDTHGWVSTPAALRIADYLIWGTRQAEAQGYGDGYTSIRHAVLAKKARCCPRTAQTWITRFEDAGWLVVVRAKRHQESGGTWSQRPNRYRWCWRQRNVEKVRRSRRFRMGVCRAEAAEARERARLAKRAETPEARELRLKKELLGSRIQPTTAGSSPDSKPLDPSPSKRNLLAAPEVGEPVEEVYISPDEARARGLLPSKPS